MIVFVDIETTGLDPDRHEMWELGLIVRNPDGDDDEYLWQFKADLSKADPAALRVSHYFNREMFVGDEVVWQLEPTQTPSRDLGQVPRHIAGLLDGATLVGAVPSFDAAFLERWLRTHGQCPTWHHRLRCVETLTAGHLRRADLGGLAGCCAALGIEQKGEHTALGDARAARDVWDAVMAS